MGSDGGWVGIGIIVGTVVGIDGVISGCEVMVGSGTGVDWVAPVAVAGWMSSFCSG